MEHANLTVVDHPLIHHNLALLRDRSTSTPEFRGLTRRLTLLVGTEAARRLPTEPCSVPTPLEVMEGRRLEGPAPLLVPVLRAGLGMVDAMLDLLPHAVVGHVGIYRDEETLEPVDYLVRLPKDLRDRPALILDPMLATGGSALRTVEALKQAGSTQVSLLCLVAAPEGVEALAEAHPEVAIFTATLDRQLNPVGFILPGLGDAGDRLFGTG